MAPAELDAPTGTTPPSVTPPLARKWDGPRPSGGVGGTRRGVKCLHAHYAWYLVGGDDPVGRWVAEQLAARGHQSRVTWHGRAQWVTWRRSTAGRCRPGCSSALPAGEPILRLMRITRLGEGVDRSGLLLPEAIERTLAVLREYRGCMGRARGANVPHGGDLGSARRRQPGSVFQAGGAKLIGTELELLSGQDEAALSFLGATAELSAESAPWLVADIGGGSTELSLAPAIRRPLP